MRLTLCLMFFGIFLSATAVQSAGRKHIENKMQTIPNSQTRTVQQLSDYINNHFDADEQRLYAIYYWLATAIRYDVRSINRIPKEQAYEQIILNTLKQRKGVCEGYAGLMDTLSKLAGIPVFTVHGFTRQQGRIDPLPHAWIAAKVNDSWYLTDPTFASGSMQNGRYVHAYDDSWFMVAPPEMIETHMPYDPTWQFLEQVVSYRTFALGEKDKPLYSTPFMYEDTIALFQRSSPGTQLLAEQRRIQLNNFRHQVISTRLEYIKEALRVNHLNDRIVLFNRATTLFNSAADNYNRYAQERNQHRLSDQAAAYLSNLLIEAQKSLNEASALLGQITNPPKDMRRHITGLSDSIITMQEQIGIELRNIGTSH